MSKLPKIEKFVKKEIKTFKKNGWKVKYDKKGREVVLSKPATRTIPKKSTRK